MILCPLCPWCPSFDSAETASVITRAVVVTRRNVRAWDPGTRHIPISHVICRPPDVTGIWRCSVIPVGSRGDDDGRWHRGRRHNHRCDRRSDDDGYANADADRHAPGGARLGNTQSTEKNRQTGNSQHEACHIAPNDQLEMRARCQVEARVFGLIRRIFRDPSSSGHYMGRSLYTALLRVPNERKQAAR
jgi:hypothetical protein